jgi:hypothetical protein
VGERKPELTPAIAAEAESLAASLDKVQRHRPRWEDYVSEGVIESVPEPDAAGELRASVSGHGAVVKMLKMNEEAGRVESWGADNRAESQSRRRRREERAEKRARKFHRASASIVVPEMPWKRKRLKGSA